MSDKTPHIVPYRTYALILLVLLTFTATSVAVTQIQLSRWSTLAALLLAGAKTSFVLAIFMHLSRIACRPYFALKYLYTSMILIAA